MEVVYFVEQLLIAFITNSSPKTPPKSRNMLNELDRKLVVFIIDLNLFCDVWYLAYRTSLGLNTKIVDCDILSNIFATEVKLNQ
jgi:hypothetical protein